MFAFRRRNCKDSCKSITFFKCSMFPCFNNTCVIALTCVSLFYKGLQSPNLYFFVCTLSDIDFLFTVLFQMRDFQKAISDLEVKSTAEKAAVKYAHKQTKQR